MLLGEGTAEGGRRAQCLWEKVLQKVGVGPNTSAMCTVRAATESKGCNTRHLCGPHQCTPKEAFRSAQNPRTFTWFQAGGSFLYPTNKEKLTGIRVGKLVVCTNIYRAQGPCGSEKHIFWTFINRRTERHPMPHPWIIFYPRTAAERGLWILPSWRRELQEPPVARPSKQAAPVLKPSS